MSIENRGTRIFNPQMRGHFMKDTMRLKHEVKSQVTGDKVEEDASVVFQFFGPVKGGLCPRGTVISKNLKRTLDDEGGVVFPFSYDQVCVYYKKKGYIVEESDAYVKRDMKLPGDVKKLTAAEKKAAAKAEAEEEGGAE